MPRELLSRRPHTHHALDDAIEQAELMSNLMAWVPPVHGMEPWARSPVQTASSGSSSLRGVRAPQV